MTRQLSLCAFVLACFAIDSCLPAASAGVSGKTYETEVTVTQVSFPQETFPDLWTFAEDGTLGFFSYLEGTWSEVDLGLFSVWSTTYTNGPGVRIQYVGIASGSTMQGVGVLYEISIGQASVGVSSVTGTEAPLASKGSATKGSRQPTK